MPTSSAATPHPHQTTEKTDVLPTALDLSLKDLIETLNPSHLKSKDARVMLSPPFHSAHHCKPPWNFTFSLSKYGPIASGPDHGELHVEPWFTLSDRVTATAWRASDTFRVRPVPEAVVAGSQSRRVGLL